MKESAALREIKHTFIQQTTTMRIEKQKAQKSVS